MTNVFLRGFADLEGQTLGVFLAGLDCGDFTVRNGVITVPLSNADVADGLLTPRWLTQVTALKRDWGANTVLLDAGLWNVPCVVGFRYKSRGQLVRPVAPVDVGSRNGPGFGKKKRNHQFAVLVSSTKGIKFGTTFVDARMHPLNEATDGEIALSPTEMADGIYVDALEDEKSYDGMIAWEVTGPYSAKVCAIGGFIDTEDR